VEGITDVSTDREPGGLQLNVAIDRKAASRLGVRVQDIDNALNNAFAQRQISIIYTQRNQYGGAGDRSEIPARSVRPRRIYVAGANGAQVPLSNVARSSAGCRRW
jgi:multidrug efflux pump